MERKLKALLVDDEQHCLDTLRFDLERHCNNQLTIIGEVQNVIAATAQINKSHPDIIFLDIDLPGMNGLEFLESIGDIDAKIVFTTAHSKYAIPAYKFKAEAFLLKPINSEELTEVVSKLYQSINEAESIFSKEKLAVNDLHGTTFIPYNEIISCESNDNYCIIRLLNGESKTVSKTLKYVEQAIHEKSFLRVHQSYLVNSKHIKKYLKRDGGTLEMSGGKMIPVSKSYREKVHKYLNL